MPHMIEQPIMVKICDVLEESSNVKTFFFHHQLHFDPGQFLMVWIPFLDEKPFTISYIQGDLIGISVLKKGVFTNAFHSKRVGDIIGIRGPYGRKFSLQPNSCAVGGGIGMAPLATIADRLHNEVTIIHGSRTASEILYQDRFKTMRLCTEDGTLGFKGTTVDLLKETLKSQRFQMVYACGPEKMLYKVVELCRDYDIACEVSLERYMKCAFGVCGQCDCSGQRVCIDGPVFDAGELSRMDDFGRIKITKTGERVLC